jgi:hypothetical protein
MNRPRFPSPLQRLGKSVRPTVPPSVRSTARAGSAGELKRGIVRLSGPVPPTKLKCGTVASDRQTDATWVPVTFEHSEVDLFFVFSSGI